MAKEARAKTKSAFIFAHGDKPAKEVVALGKEAGFAFNEKTRMLSSSAFRT